MCLFRSSPNPRVFGDDQPLFGTNSSTTAASTGAIHPLCPCCSTYHPTNAAIPPVSAGDFATRRTFRDVFSDRIAASNTAAFPSFSNLPPLSNHQQSLFGTNTRGRGSAAFPSFSNLPPLSNHQPSLFATNTNGGGSAAAFAGCSNLPPLSNHQPLFGTNTSGGGSAAFAGCSNLPPLSNHQPSLFGNLCPSLPPLSNHQPSLFGTNTSGGGLFAKQDQEKSIFNSTAFPVHNSSATPPPFLVNYNAASKFSNTSAFPSFSKPELAKSTHQQPLFGINSSTTTTAAINPLWSGNMNFCTCCGQRNVTNAAAYALTTAAIPQVFGGGLSPLSNANTAFSFSNSAPISKLEPAKFPNLFCPAFPSFSKHELPKSTHQQPPLFGTNTGTTTTAAINPLWSGNINFCPCCGQRNVTNAAAYHPTTAAIPPLSGGGFGPLSNANTAFSFSNSAPISKLEPAKFTNLFCPGSCCGVHGNGTTKATYRPTYDLHSWGNILSSISAMCFYPARSHEELRWDYYSSQGKSCSNPFVSAQTNSTSVGGGFTAFPNANTVFNFPNTGYEGCFSNPKPEPAQSHYPPTFPTSTGRPLFESCNLM